MLADQWLSVIKAEREREMKAAQRAHLVDRNRLDGETGEARAPDSDRSIWRFVRRTVQPGTATADPSV